MSSDEENIPLGESPFQFSLDDFVEAGYTKRQFNAASLIHSKVTTKLKHCSWCSSFIYREDECWMKHIEGTRYPIQNLLKDAVYPVYMKQAPESPNSTEPSYLVVCCARCKTPSNRQHCPISPAWPNEILAIPIKQHVNLAPFSVSSDFVTRRKQSNYSIQFSSMTGDWKWSRNKKALGQYLGVPGIQIGLPGKSITPAIKQAIGLFSHTYP
jgi:hypothetical protein